MKRLDEKGWAEIRKVAIALNSAGGGSSVDIVVPASSICELFSELEALRAEVSKQKPRLRATPPSGEGRE